MLVFKSLLAIFAATSVAAVSTVEKRDPTDTITTVGEIIQDITGAITDIIGAIGTSTLYSPACLLFIPIFEQ